MSKGVRNAVIATVLLLLLIALLIDHFKTPRRLNELESLPLSQETISVHQQRNSQEKNKESLSRELERQLRRHLNNGQGEEAAELLKRLQQLPHSSISPQQMRLLAQAVDEVTTLRRGESPYAIVSFDGVEGDVVGDEVLEIVDQAIGDLAQLFNFMPEKKIEVVIFSEPRFASAQGGELPEWVEAGFDGKLRLPIELIHQNDRRVEVIRHELSHAFIHLITGSNLPIWLDEGVAQHVEGRQLPGCWPREWEFPTLEQLITQFVQTARSEEAALLYWSALALFEHLLQLKGWASFQNYLADLQRGKQEADAFINQFELTPQQLWADGQIALVTRFCATYEQESEDEEEAEAVPSEENSSYLQQEEPIAPDHNDEIDPRLSPEAEEFLLYPENSTVDEGE